MIKCTLEISGLSLEEIKTMLDTTFGEAIFEKAAHGRATRILREGVVATVAIDSVFNGCLAYFADRK